MKTAENLGWMDNPIPVNAQTAISGLGAVFATANVGAELFDGDFEGAVWDLGNSVVSLTSGAKLLGLSDNGALGMYAAGAVLNTALAMKQLKVGDRVEAGLRLGNVTGISLSVAGGLTGGPTGAALSSAGLAVRGVVGLTSIVRDLTDRRGFLHAPDRFS